MINEELYRKQRSFCKPAADRYFPERDSIIIMGNGENPFGTLGACISKIHSVTTARDFFNQEPYTPKNCSFCRRVKCENRTRYDNHLGRLMSSKWDA